MTVSPGFLPSAEKRKAGRRGRGGGSSPGGDCSGYLLLCDKLP